MAKQKKINNFPFNIPHIVNSQPNTPVDFLIQQLFSFFYFILLFKGKPHKRHSIVKMRYNK